MLPSHRIYLHLIKSTNSANCRVVYVPSNLLISRNITHIAVPLILQVEKEILILNRAN